MIYVRKQIVYIKFQILIVTQKAAGLSADGNLRYAPFQVSYSLLSTKVDSSR
jgi:hypothetical protein